MPKPTSSQIAGTEIHTFKRKDPFHPKGTVENESGEKGVTTRGVTVTTCAADMETLQKGLQFVSLVNHKPLHQREVVSLKRVFSFFNKLTQWLRNKFQSRQRESFRSLQAAGRPFLPARRSKNPKTSLANVDRFIAATDCSKRIKSLMTQVEKLEKEYNILGREGDLIIRKLLLPESTEYGTSLQTVKTALTRHGINLHAHLASPDAQTGLAEIKLTLSDEQLHAMKDTHFFHAYQLFLIINGLQQATSIRRGELSIEEGKEAREEEKALQAFSQTLMEMVNLTTGLCHATMKAEMPKLYKDDFYTALSLQDERGRSHFRSDSVQPRGGWKDLI
ncbi:hypothetical protein [Sansalvadorimonas verongulae]|uniref:hypothetical protein n=1 Tax=Sansalvadorimonas verongulae TaxID=2172824 RepID=UPI0012BC678A|nr:hypothetical protein [Sansalvadorimonas verongulae]MTI15048.1 hypothetical protein [Sansalvadorimonas verongulae]